MDVVPLVGPRRATPVRRHPAHCCTWRRDREAPEAVCAKKNAGSRAPWHMPHIAMTGGPSALRKSSVRLRCLATAVLGMGMPISSLARLLAPTALFGTQKISVSRSLC